MDSSSRQKHRRHTVLKTLEKRPPVSPRQPSKVRLRRLLVRLSDEAQRVSNAPHAEVAAHQC